MAFLSCRAGLMRTNPGKTYKRKAHAAARIIVFKHTSKKMHQLGPVPNRLPYFHGMHDIVSVKGPEAPS